MNVNEQIYFEHHGVKGQKWGVRKERTTNRSSSSGRIPKPKRTPAQKQERMRKVEQTIRITAGLLSITSMLSQMANTPTSSLSNRGESGHHQEEHSWNKKPNPRGPQVRAQEAQRNGAFQAREFLRKNGSEVVSFDQSVHPKKPPPTDR